MTIKNSHSQHQIVGALDFVIVIYIYIYITKGTVVLGFIHLGLKKNIKLNSV